MEWTSFFPLEVALHIAKYTTPQSTLNMSNTCKMLYYHSDIEDCFTYEFTPELWKIRKTATKCWRTVYSSELDGGKREYCRILSTFRPPKRKMEWSTVGKLVQTGMELPIRATLIWTLSTAGVRGVLAATKIGFNSMVFNAAPLSVLSLSACLFLPALTHLTKDDHLFRMNMSPIATFAPAMIFAGLFKNYRATYSIPAFTSMGIINAVLSVADVWFNQVKKVWDEWDRPNREARRIYEAALMYHRECDNHCVL